MIWNEKFGLWLDPDTRTEQQKIEDERIAANVEADQERIKESFAKAKAAEAVHSSILNVAAESLCDDLLLNCIKARKQMGFSQAEVARRMQMPQSAVVRFEAGVHSPTLITIARYAVAVGFSLSVDLVDLTRERPNNGSTCTTILATEWGRTFSAGLLSLQANSPREKLRLLLDSDPGPHAETGGVYPLVGEE